MVSEKEFIDYFNYQESIRKSIYSSYKFLEESRKIKLLRTIMNGYLEAENKEEYKTERVLDVLSRTLDEFHKADQNRSSSSDEESIEETIEDFDKVQAQNETKDQDQTQDQTPPMGH